MKRGPPPPRPPPGGAGAPASVSSAKTEADDSVQQANVDRLLEILSADAEEIDRLLLAEAEVELLRREKQELESQLAAERQAHAELRRSLAVVIWEQGRRALDRTPRLKELLKRLLPR